MNVMRRYWNTIYLVLLFLTPFACFCAGAWYTFCRFRGAYAQTSWSMVLIFDASHILYILGAVFLWLYKKKKEIDTECFFRIIKGYIAVILLIQYTLITFLFPDNFTWGCTFLFLIFILFAFDFKYMIFNLCCYLLLALMGHIVHYERYFSGESVFESALFRIIIFVLYGMMSVAVSYFVDKFIKQMQEWEDDNAFLAERQLEYYQNLDLMDKELRKFRHDIKNHFVCMQELIEREDLSGLRMYFKDLADGSLSGKKIYFSGNVIIDSILNYHIYKMCSVYVKPVVYGRLPEIETVSSMDLCTIFSNMLSNAVKGANLLNRENELVVRFQGGEKFFSICVINQTEMEEGKAVSGKRDGREGQEKQTGRKRKKTEDRNHGYGLKKIKEVTEKYAGVFEMTKDRKDGSYRMQVYLPV